MDEKEYLKGFRESVHLLSFVSIHALITNNSYLFLKIRPVRPLAKIFLFIV